ncbi:MAG: ribose-5-phosphate isomerase RpiA [Deinococcus-Thermus bacterium]|nr:ribose-5-phosphate isomerase RpiA [Deinococcota bacterium]
MSAALKRAAAESALAEVRSGMRLGLGSGSTAGAFLEALGERLRTGELQNVRGVPTSRETERTARRLGIPLIDLPEGGVDLAVDGMDEIDPDLDAIKGLGGALLREKIVAAAARRFVLVGDAGKRVDRLGDRAPLPVEVLGFGVARTAARLRDLGLTPNLRGGELEPFLSDNGHPILDCDLPAGLDAAAVQASLATVPGVLGDGLFLGMAAAAYLAGEEGVTRLERPA